MTAPDPEAEALVREQHDIAQACPDCHFIGYDKCTQAAVIRRAVEAGIAVGKRTAYDECQTCGCTGTMTVEQLDGDGCAVGPSEDVTCAECNGTGVGSFGQMLADAKAEGAREAADLLDWMREQNEESASDMTETSRTYFVSYRDGLCDGAAAIRARGGGR